MSMPARLFALILSFGACAVFASPAQLITHNRTDFELNAYIAGSIPSQHPTKAHSDNAVFWPIVRMSCVGHTANNICPALVRVATDTANPIDIGMVYLNLATGVITPNTIENNGFILYVNGPGETTIIAK